MNFPKKIITVVGAVLLAGFAAVTILRRAAPVDHEGNKNRCAQIRSALSIYYSDAQGHYPQNLTALIPKYLNEIPEVKGIREHPSSRHVVLANDLTPTDSGGWLYVNNPQSPHFGEVKIDCTHIDGGRPWFDF